MLLSKNHICNRYDSKSYRHSRADALLAVFMEEHMEIIVEYAGLKPCPFCGYPAEMNDFVANDGKALSVVVGCPKCHARVEPVSKLQNSPEDAERMAAEKWNRRAQ